MHILKILSSCLFLLVIFSCQNDDDQINSNSNTNPSNESFKENFGDAINRDFQGLIIDINKNPIANATITIGNSTTQTDENGLFFIQGANVYERFGYVKVEKPGYIHGSRTVVPSSGTNKVTIMLLEESIIGSTNSGEIATISLPNGASVELEGSYVKADGSAYNGAVNVIMHHLDPTDDNMANQMPGDLYASNMENEERMLVTFGMLAIELRGSNGEDLNLAEGSTAEITVPVDASLLANAPSTIPLWYFDENSGYWVEEGQATLIDNEYVGTVSHFSFWNCDVDVDAVMLCLTITDDDNNPLPSINVSLSHGYYGTSSGITDENGQVCGFVPGNELLDVSYTIEYSSCAINNGTIIGPFTLDSSISLSIDSSNWTSETVSGVFTNCMGEIISDGYIRMFNNNNILMATSYVNSEGQFDIAFTRCTDDSDIFKLQGYDLENYQNTAIETFNYTSPTTNIGSINTCNTIDEYFTYQLDNDPEINDDNSSSIYAFIIEDFNNQGGILNISYTDPFSGDRFTIEIRDDLNPISTGTYITDNASNTSILISFDNGEYTIPTDVTNTFSATVLSIGEIGEIINLTFSGTFIDANSNEHSLSGEFRALREQ